MRSHITREFRRRYRALPKEVQDAADRAYAMWNQDPYHSSLQFKALEGQDDVYSVRIGLHWRALAIKDGDEVTWFWIGSHGDYDSRIG
jgi:hypothetical protein